MIEELPRPPRESDLRDLAAVLVDAVAAGGSVSFLGSITLEAAQTWWAETIRAAHPRAILLVARDELGIAGTVQLQPAWAPNQPHRAEVAKLLVHRRARRRSLGRALMEALEDRPRSAGFTLLTLDTKRGDAAEQLYRRSGWSYAGIIPGYALDPDGTPCDTVIFYKQLG
jgi:GNAT superfamily N-acetyltransferase